MCLRPSLQLVAVLALTGATLVGAQTAGPPFSGPLDTMERVAVVEHQPAFSDQPLTVELWAKLRSEHTFNILVANEPKASSTHWEIFTWPGSGSLTVYHPGCTPDHTRTDVRITDGQWRHIVMVAEKARVRLFVDGQMVADQTVSRLAEPNRVPGPLVIGSLVERGLSCDGEIAEVRISRAVRVPRARPSAPLEPDEATVGLWTFESLEGDTVAGKDPTGLAATLVPAPLDFTRVDITKLTAAESARIDRANLPIAGRSIAIPPPEVDLERSRSLLRAALAELDLPSLQGLEPRDAVLYDWEEQRFRLGMQLRGEEPLPPGGAEYAFDRHALVWESDGDPLGTVLRRTEALLARLEGPSPEDTPLGRDLARLKAWSDSVPLSEEDRRHGAYLVACGLRRAISFANPLLDFDRILFVARGVYLGSRVTGPAVTGDVYGQHFTTQYFAFNSIPGGGLFVVEGWKGPDPHVRNLLADSIVQNGRLAGRTLQPGAFLSPDLSYDGERIVFAYTENKEHEWVWSPETTWNLFSVRADGTDLRQLTDSRYNDFDPVWLPNGRIAFISERRGGFIRCFALLHVPTYVLHSMKPDGSDIYPLSYFETSEWHPSVDNNGMIVYTRWDYVDRENCLGSNLWICYPDGRDPRAPHGNYPYPWHTYPDNVMPDTRFSRPYVEMNIRAIPGSHRYILTAAPHHGEAFGALAILDLRIPDDGVMSQLRKITPYVPFPETQVQPRSQYAFGTPWPLSEDFYLCNWWENLYLLDRYGNQELILANAEVFGGTTNWDMRLIDPIPLKPRPMPPVIPTATNQGEDANPAGPKATIAIMNVYDSDQPLPEGVRIKYVRVVQNILKSNPWMGIPMIGYQNENTPRIPLGIVPVEEDGSAYFEAPVERELMFQLLDENYMAVHSMRSVAYVHPGEQLTCQGCHEPRETPPTANLHPAAMRRDPSPLTPELGPVEPIYYYRHAKPVFERSCIPCHQQEGGPVDMSYEALEPYVFYFAGGMSGQTIQPIHGGSRTIPGRFGARASRMGQALLDENHRGRVPEEDAHQIILWLDCNSLRLGAYEDEEAQMRGELVWPSLDVDPTDPQGLRPLWSGRP